MGSPRAQRRRLFVVCTAMLGLLAVADVVGSPAGDIYPGQTTGDLDKRVNLVLIRGS
jgi:hypothetical protein